MRFDTATDTELGSLAHGGDVEALATLLERCRPSLYATAIGLLGNRADAHDAVQDTSLTALARFGELRDASAAGAWLQTVVRNECLMRLRQRRELPVASVEPPGAVPDPCETLDAHAMREWVWDALEALPPEERITLMLRYFTRCESYAAIARLTGVPVGTVRSRLHRARTRLADALMGPITGTTMGHTDVEVEQRQRWEDFYRTLHECPVPRTYRDLFVPEIDVRDRHGHWVGTKTWSAHEREAIALGVRARIVDLFAATNLVVLEIDFTNPPTSPSHCPPQATFVHRLDHGRSRDLRIHYPFERQSSTVQQESAPTP